MNDVTKKIALITGFTGMVGSHLADHLLSETDWVIIGLMRWRSRLDNINHLSPQINNGDRVFVEFADINDLGSLIHVLERNKPDYIFHLAAQSYPKTSFESPAETLQTNIIGTCNVLEAVRLVGLNPIIHICASSEIFGKIPEEYLPISEDAPIHPASPYAISKVGTDLLGRYYAEAYGMCAITTRMFTHTGPRRGDVFAESSFAKQIAMIEKGLIDPVVKTGNLDSLRTWADVRDAVSAYRLLVTNNPIPGEYYNIGGTYTCTIRAMLQTLIDLSTRKDIVIEQVQNRMRPIDADLQVPNTNKFCKHTGWEPVISFEQTMSDLLDYWRAKLHSNNDGIVR